MNKLTLLSSKPESFPLSCQSPPAPPDVSVIAVRTHQRGSERVIISVVSLGGPHIKVQFQALHLMVMALPDANRDTAQVSGMDLIICHRAHLGKTEA